MKKSILLTGLALMTVSANAQCFKDGYVEFGFDSPKFADAVEQWVADNEYNEDDNFFISRVKPKERFRNVETQVNPELDATNDKRLLAWIPVNNPLSNALPDGKFDSEVFNMWSYVTHYGDWTGTVGRIPGAFSDVAHKNGVGVSGVASIPYGGITYDWSAALQRYSELDHQQAYNFLKYYGNDGIGYNSEFSGAPQQTLSDLRALHVGLNKAAKEDGNPVFENFWYDGTNDRGGISFDRGLGGHNSKTFGAAGSEAASLFLNYNWNDEGLLSGSVDVATNKLSRDPLYLYAGVNMQGGQPTYNSWPLLAKFPISIGLWGAHSMNMFWESRNEQGSTDDAKLRTYMLRTERYFTGGSRNPVNTPEVTSLMAYHAGNTEFHGMSSFMTARSSLKWDLSVEPFISYFNLGNGKFFNWNGVRQNNNEWYNIGVQDYLPTWRYWFTDKLLAKNAAAVPEKGLDAEFTWDDAYVGGSCLRIFGSASEEYLHLFKTEYTLQAGDVITVRYKLNKGMTGLNLVLTAKGAETQAINENGFALISATSEADEDLWVKKTFTVGEELAGKDLALVALHFQGAQDIDLNLGEFSIVRGEADAPATPVIKSSKVLAYNHSGIDGKIIFNMPNDKAKGDPCYNIDVKTSLFKLYAQQEGAEPVFMGLTTSWAGLIYSAPIDFKLESKKVRFGVAAVSLDMKKDSEIAWTEYSEPVAYVYSDNVEVDKTTIKPGESFTMSYTDSNHESANWKLVNASTGDVAFEGDGVSVTVDGINEIGSYDLVLTGNVYAQGSTDRVSTERRFGSFVQITGEGVGALPEIYTLTANDKEADIKVEANEQVDLAYTGRKSDGSGSQAVDLKEQRFGCDAYELGVTNYKPFSVSAWMKINSLSEGETQLLAIANKMDGWPKTDWGWIWTNCDSKGKMTSFTFRGTDATSNNELRYRFGNTTLPIGSWFHICYVFEMEGNSVHCDFYINGVKQECTEWNRATDGDNYKQGEPKFQNNIYELGKGMVISLGGVAAGRNGIDGAVDNFAIWNKALTADEVKVAMGDIDKNNLPANVAGFWDLEETAADGKGFVCVGDKAGAKAGLHNYESTGAEGQGMINWLEAEVTSGCPFVSGSAFPVVTVPTWKAKKGVITDAQGNGEAGSAKVSYKRDGVYDVTLTLANSLGSDSKTFKSITVGAGETGIENAEVLETEVTVENGVALVNFATEGNYAVNVYNAAGQLVASKAQFMTAGQQAQLALGQAGVYVLSVQKDGKTVANVKLLNK